MLSLTSPPSPKDAPANLITVSDTVMCFLCALFVACSLWLLASSVQAGGESRVHAPCTVAEGF